MDEQKQQVDATEAARALEAIHGTRREVAGRVGAPKGYYLKLGVAIAVLTLAQPMEDPWRLGATFAALAVMLWAMRSYTRSTRSWTLASLRIPGAWRFYVMAATMVVALFAAMTTRDWVVCSVGAAAVLALVPTLGPRWDADWVRSLEGDA